MQGIVIAGTHSGCGKTTVTLGILAALRKMGVKAQSFKAGPDFIDSGLHRTITDRQARNLDIWMCGEDYVRDCFYKYSMGADISIVEGVMGMYDGEHSTAELASILGLPVILVVDAYGMAESAGAVVAGFRDWGLGIGMKGKNTNPQPLTPNPLIVGVIFSRVASKKHYERLKNSVHDVQVLGYLPRDINFEIPHRHLGLTVAEENPITEENIDKLADAVLEHIDVEWICNCGMRNISIADCEMRIAESKSEIRNPKSKIKIAVAYDRTFCFYYEDNLDLLRYAGAEITTFSPLRDTKIPDNVDALYIGGGYPELYAKELSGNTPMLKSIKEWADSGRPLYAECGGLMYLSEGIHDFSGNFFKMVGLFPFETQMKKGNVHLGYREIELNDDCIIGKKGDRLRGHEFHYSEITNGADEQTSRRAEVTSELSMAYSLKNNSGESLPDEGYRYKNALASYVHLHFGSNSGIAQNFIRFIQECHSRANGNPVSCEKTWIPAQQIAGMTEQREK
ncbi:MAG: cobyrinate a,c-diamide synthase [Nitrospirae bacterium]|nr:MAG: cobyrinate a,c-diamide synthase [Nitrospirota bacterium]